MWRWSVWLPVPHRLTGRAGCLRRRTALLIAGGDDARGESILMDRGRERAHRQTPQQR